MFLQKPMLGTQLDHSDSLNNPVLDLLFNEGHGNIVNDLSGYGNHGTLHGFDFPPTKTSGWNPGLDSVGLTFDGINNYITVSNSESLYLPNAFTIDTLIKPNSISDCGTINEHLNHHIFRFYDNTLEAWVHVDDSWYITSVVYTDTDNWSRIIFEYDTSWAIKKSRIYINGRESNYLLQETILTGNLTTPTNEMMIGGRDGTSNILDGAIARLCILPRTMSAFEVMQTQINPYAGYL